MTPQPTDRPDRPTRIAAQPTAAPAPKRQLDQRAALRSALRMWLVARDSVIWLLVAGETDQTGGAAIPEFDSNTLLADMTPSLDQMEHLRRMAYSLAGQISATGAEGVLRDELRDLLEHESPKFLLSVDGIPGAF